MRKLYDQFGDNQDKKEFVSTTTKERQRRTYRRAANTRNTVAQSRTVKCSYIAEQKHNKIQEALVKLLQNKYGSASVVIEENYIDIKLIQPTYITFYEVKSSSYASECIKEALGQILLYSLNDTDKRPKKHIIVGQYPATENDKKYIAFLKQNLLVELDYLNVEIEQ